MGLYCSGGCKPALLLHAWLELEVRDSVGTCYLFDQGWTQEETGNAACQLPASPEEMSPTLWNHLDSIILWDRV